MPDHRVVIIHVEGGTVCEVEQPPDVAVHVIDLDTEGADEEKLCNCDIEIGPHFHEKYPAVAAEADLLAALEELLEWESRMGGWDAPCWEQARAAIAKASPQAP